MNRVLAKLDRIQETLEKILLKLEPKPGVRISCPNCGGTGSVDVMPCFWCKGIGNVSL